jgi:CubicO group peptidase (beta-lactamase class C family)
MLTGLDAKKLAVVKFLDAGVWKESGSPKNTEGSTSASARRACVAKEDAMGSEIRGTVAAGFERVADCFEANFSREDGYRELGASFVAFRGEDLIADLHGGHRDAARTTPWTADTLVNIWSATKGVTALAVGVLVDRGLLDYAAPVARYWPEFAQNGKDEVTVSQLLSHQAGLPGFVEPTTVADFYDWERVTSRLARQAPMWPPGEKNAYHAMTYGFLAGELVRRASGLSVGTFLAGEIAGPLGADVFIGLPQEEEPRVAPLVPSPNQAPFDLAKMPPEARASVTNPDMKPTLPNDRAWRAAEIPAGNGHATAMGLARLYAMAANGGTFDGVRLMSAETVAALNTVQTERVDLGVGVAPRWRNGVCGNVDHMFGPNPEAFGHPGWGGSFGSADVEAGIAMGYVLNQMGDRSIGDPRGAALANALYACL